MCNSRQSGTHTCVSVLCMRKFGITSWSVPHHIVLSIKVEILIGARDLSSKRECHSSTPTRKFY